MTTVAGKKKKIRHEVEWLNCLDNDSHFHQTRAVVQLDENNSGIIHVISVIEQQMLQALYCHASLQFPAFCVLWCDSNDLSEDIMYVFLGTVWLR